MGSLFLADALVLACSTGSSLAPPVPASTRAGVAQCFAPRPTLRRIPLCVRNPSGKSRISATALRGGGALRSDDSVRSNNSVYVVGDFMTKKEELRVVKPTTTVDEALEMLVNNRITGFPVIDDDWKLEARDAEHLFVGICHRVKEWASLLCNVNQSNSQIFSFLGV